MKNSVVVLGIAGTGKTVLWSVLANRYKDTLQPLSETAFDFQQAFQTLQNGDWLPPTNPLAKKDVMLWELIPAISRERKKTLINCDFSGETLLNFMKEHLPKATDNDKSLVELMQMIGKKAKMFGADLTKRGHVSLESVEEQIKNAAAICILLDLTDDVNGKDNKIQKMFVKAVACCLEHKHKTNCPLALVATKCNTIGDETKVSELLGEYRQKFKGMNMKITCIPIDAVADTVFCPEEKCLKPSKGFSSKNLDILLDWMTNSLVKGNKRCKRKHIIILSAIFACLVAVCFMRGLGIFGWIVFFSLLFVLIYYPTKWFANR